jgi:glutamate-5-semialdehyde dehydrogenase
MPEHFIHIFQKLKQAQSVLAVQNRERKDAALNSVCAAISTERAAILAANAADVGRARSNGMKESLIDRLSLTDARIDGVIESIEAIIRLDDPIGRVKAGWKTPNGLFIERITAPLGVAAVIYESRPNVTVDAFALAYKAGCAVLLRGSSAALASNRALVSAIKHGLASAAGSAAPNGCVDAGDAVALADSGGRDEIDEILQARGYIDVVLPRGGHELIRRVVQNARIPVIETGEGNCHIFVDASAAIENAVDIIENAKMQKPGACNAVETLLVHASVLSALMPLLVERFAGKAELRCDGRSKRAAERAAPCAAYIKDATEDDWAAEFLDYILAIKTVDTLDEAIAHINRYGTRHSEAILTADLNAAEQFYRQVDAACVYTNASTRFTDGGEFGFGAELGISTQKFHARGPMGIDALTTTKYRITGSGQVRRG